MIKILIALLLAAGAWGGDNKSYYEGKAIVDISECEGVILDTLTKSTDKLLYYLYCQLDSLRAEIDSLKNRQVFRFVPSDGGHKRVDWDAIIRAAQKYEDMWGDSLTTLQGE